MLIVHTAYWLLTSGLYKRARLAVWCLRELCSGPATKQPPQPQSKRPTHLALLPHRHKACKVVAPPVARPPKLGAPVPVQGCRD